MPSNIYIYHIYLMIFLIFFLSIFYRSSKLHHKVLRQQRTERLLICKIWLFPRPPALRKNNYKGHSDRGTFQLSSSPGTQRHKHKCLIYSILVTASSVLAATSSLIA